ncbi:hypothetical protein [Cryobacterium sp. GrIS_2_6]|uniref:hypothetical protein n=1 Tax=Cryobacterium sp. GrIS_2_6 TaxID=3162785 RepID=UPI002DFAB62D|nr:hypothetical protein [Cryobacterium psychrotolerans]
MTGEKDDDAATEQLTDETISLVDECVRVALLIERNVRERGWDAEADRIAADLRLALFIDVAHRILRLESREPHQIGEDT